MNPILLQALLSSGTFILLWLVLGNLLFKPLFRLLDEREARTVGDEQAAVEKRQESRALMAQITEKLQDARIEGVRLRDARVAQAKKDAQVILDRAGQQANEELKRSQQSIAELKAKAFSEVSVLAEKLAQLIVERALASTPTTTIH